MGVLLALTFSLSVSALDNVMQGNIIVTGVSVDESNSFPFNQSLTLPYGQHHLIKVQYDSYDYYESSLFLNGSFTITLTDTVDLYFAYNAYNTSNISYDVIPYSGLSQYRDSSKDFSINQVIPNTAYNVFYDGDNDDISVSSFNNSSTYSVGYRCYSNIPAGTYVIEYQHYHLPASGDFTGEFILGLYAVNPEPPTEDPGSGEDQKPIIEGFKDGTYSFEQALEMLIQNMEDVINEPFMNTEYKNFYVNYTSAMIDLLEKSSDIIYNSSVSDFNDQGEVIIDSFIESNTQDVSSFITQLTNLFTSTLESASTAEQGSFISSVFSNLLAKLQLAYEMSLYDVVTDDEVAENEQDKIVLKDYFSQEDDALEMFDRAEYEAMLDFNSWISELSNYQQYRNIFEWFFSSSGELRVFIIMPFAFVLVSLLLGTTTVIVKSESAKVRSEKEKVAKG